MENSKLFTSLNNKKGVLLQVKEGNLGVSIWKKETQISTTLDKDSAMELCEFIISNLRSPIDEEENLRKINFWARAVENSKSWQPVGEDALSVEGDENIKEVRKRQPVEEDAWENEGGGNAEKR